MRLVHALGAAVAATTLVASVAQATITMSLVPIPVDAGAAATIGGGQTVRTFQLRATQTGEKWDVGSMEVTLAANAKLSGYFYADPTVHSNATGENKSYLNPGQTPSSPSFYDTYVTTPVFNASPTAGTAATNLNVPGSSDFPGVGTATQTPTVPQTGSNSAGSNQTLDIVWGDPRGVQSALPDGSYTVAQFTIVGNTGAFLRGYSGGSSAANTAQYFTNNGTGPIAASTAQGLMYIPIRGDVNLDGAVDQLDINAMLAHFAKAGTYADGDLTQDGLIDQNDINQVLATFTNNIGTAPAVSLGSVVPEPSICGLLLVGAAGMISRRSRR